MFSSLKFDDSTVFYPGMLTEKELLDVQHNVPLFQLACDIQRMFKKQGMPLYIAGYRQMVRPGFPALWLVSKQGTQVVCLHDDEALDKNEEARAAFTMWCSHVPLKSRGSQHQVTSIKPAYLIRTIAPVVSGIIHKVKEYESNKFGYATVFHHVNTVCDNPYNQRHITVDVNTVIAMLADAKNEKDILSAPHKVYSDVRQLLQKVEHYKASITNTVDKACSFFSVPKWAFTTQLSSDHNAPILHNAICIGVHKVVGVNADCFFKVMSDGSGNMNIEWIVEPRMFRSLKHFFDYMQEIGHPGGEDLRLTLRTDRLYRSHRFGNERVEEEDCIPSNPANFNSVHSDTGLYMRGLSGNYPFFRFECAADCNVEIGQ